MNDTHVTIVGAGPAGLSAALWLKNLGFTSTVIEKSSVTGGMLNVNFLENDWVLGQVDTTGVDIANNYYEHIVKEDIDVRTQCYLQAITTDTNGFRLVSHAQQEWVTQAIIFANGTRYRGRDVLPLGQSLSDIALSRIVEGPHAFIGLDEMSSEHIAIVGAGDNAFENAVLLLEQGCSVTMIARSKPKAQSRFLEKVLNHHNFTLLECSQIVSVNEINTLLSIVTKGAANANLEVDRLHILAGYQSNVDSFFDLIDRGLAQSLDCDNNDFLVVDAQGRTNIQGIYAAGDICNTQFPCVVSAVSSGALAAKTISQDFI